MVVKRLGGEAPQPRLRRHHFLENVQTKTFTPLEYQVELLDTAKHQNSIVFLSSGKTFMVVMLVKELAYQVRPSFEDGGKRVLILVPSAESGIWHQKMMEDYTDLKSVLIGDPAVGKDERPVDFPKLFRDHHVLVMTAGSFNRHWVEADADISEELVDHLNLIVFDECNEALRHIEFEPVLGFIMDYVMEGRLSVLGLAAPLATKKRQRPSLLEAEILELEDGFQSVACTSSELTVVSKYGSRPREVVVEYAAYGCASGDGESTDDLKTALRLLDEAMEFLGGTEGQLDERARASLRQFQRYLVELCYTLVTLGPWCAREVADLFLKEVSQVVDSLGPAVNWSRMALLLVHTVIQQVAKLTTPLAADLEPSDAAHQPAKFRHLLRILREYRPSQPQQQQGTIANSHIVQENCVAVQNSVNELDSSTQESNMPAVVDSTVQPTSSPVLPNDVNGVVRCSDDSEALSGSSPDKKVPMIDGTAPSAAVRPGSVAMSTASVGVPATRPSNAVGVSSRPAGHRADLVDDPNALCGIVFVRQRITAYILSMWLTKLATRFPNEYGFITPNFLVGRTTPPALGDGSSNRSGQQSLPNLLTTPLGLQRQEEVLQKFRSRECNLLVATSVVQEGIEVPRCNLVAAGSRYFVLVPHDESSRFLGDLHDYRTTEQILLERSHVEDTTIDEEVDAAYADSLKPAYKPLEAEDAPRVSMSTAIALVNRYCAKLPSDTFTRLTPISSMAEVETEGSEETLYSCSLRLPINSPLRRCIVGDPMPSKLLAKQAAALRTCEELHKMGELDDNLVPQGKEAMRMALDQGSAGRFPEEDIQPGGPRPGTTKRRQYYDKKVSEVLKGKRVCESDEFHLYAFTMKLTCPIPEEQNTRGRKIHDPADTARGFGLVTSRRIPLICSFPVFTRSGEVTVELEHVSSDIGQLTSNQVRDLTTFHRYTFTNVLRLEKYPMTFNPDGDACSFLVVPINAVKPTDDQPGSTTIDWKFEEDYLDTVVTPWYRNLDKPQFFYVAEICHDLNPLSDFPDAGFDTFDAYYREKYQIRVVDGHQPLLDVDHTSASSQLADATIREPQGGDAAHLIGADQAGQAREPATKADPRARIVRHPSVPASLWRKAVCLPCILYRMNSLLLAEQLRLTVAREVRVGRLELPEGFKWPTLDFGWTLAEVLQKAQEAAKAEEERVAELMERTGIQPVRLSPPPPVINAWRQPQPYQPPVFQQDQELVIDTFDPSKVHIP
ncbi:hypothetical protein MRX96_042427 [Rhipicephalus microplus]